MCNVSMALEAIKPACKVCRVADLMTLGFHHNVLDLVAFHAAACVHFAAKNSAPAFTGKPHHYVTRPVEMSPELADQTGFGMAIYTISFGVDGPCVSRSLPPDITRLHDLAASTKTGLLRIYRHSANGHSPDEDQNPDNDDNCEGPCHSHVRPSLIAVQQEGLPSSPTPFSLHPALFAGLPASVSGECDNGYRSWAVFRDRRHPIPL
jgi:hypothetical protein